MFQAKLKGWKRLAASLVLLPGLTAVGAEVLHLFGTARAQESVNSRPASAPKTPTSEDARLLVKRARDALDAGRLEIAIDLARQADANSRNTKWGLFDDTPESVLKDAQKARGRLDRQKAERLVSQARALYEKRSSVDEVRAANLDKARSLCLEAIQLQGPSSMWYFGDRPESLLKDIDNVRSKINVASRPMNPETTATPRPAPKPDDLASDLLNPNTATNTRPNREYQAPDRRAFDVGASPQPSPKVSTPAANPGLEAGFPISEPSGHALAEPAEDALGGGTVVSKPIRQKKPPVIDSNAGVPLMPEPVVPSPQVEITGTLPKLPDPIAPIPQPSEQPPSLIPSKAPDGVVALPLPGETIGTPNADNLPPKIETPSPVQAAVKPNPNKLQAVELMQQAVAFQNDNKYVEARRALADAQTLKASFEPEESTPDMAMQSLIAAAQKRIDNLCRDAHESMVKKTAADVAASEQRLNEADSLAAELGLDPGTINDHKVMLRAVKQHVETVASAKPMTPGPISGDLPTVIPPPGSQSGEPMAAVKPVDQGMELLKQARLEMHDGRFDSARKIAYEILGGDYTCKKEAENLLRTCEAEEFEIRKMSALRAYERGVEALQSRNYEQALSIFKLIDSTLLPAAKKKELANSMVIATQSLDKSSKVVQTALPPADPERTGADSLVKQEEAMRELQFQKLRAEGLQLEASATARFGKGDTDGALQDLSNFIARVDAANIDPVKRTLLEKPIEARIERLKVLKHQQDFLTKEAKGLKDFRAEKSDDQLKTAYKQEETARLMKQFAKLTQEGKYQEAGKVALQAKELDPDNPAVTAAMAIAQIKYRKQKWDKEKAEDEEGAFILNSPSGYIGPVVDVRGDKPPVHFDKEIFEGIRNRPSTSGNGINVLRPRTPADRKIESELNSQQVSISFNNEPLDRALIYLQTQTGLNFDLDTPALQAAGIDPATPITSNLINKITLKSALDIVLSKAKLSYVVEKEVIRVTTQRGRAGKLVQQTIPVADLIVPVQNYTPSPVTNLNTMYERLMNLNQPQINGSTVAQPPPTGLNASNGTNVSSANGGFGTLRNSPSTPGSTSGVTIGSPSGTIEESLIRLITSSVQPDTWEAMGGAGRIQYYPLGMALVINQTPDVIEEVIRLLESLRQLQDLEVAIEVRMITLAESFYERIGLNFSMNIDTGNKNALVSLSGSTASQSNLLNLKNVGARLVGLQVPGVPTPDLNLPISPSSFGLAIPPFGGYPNAPGADGGLSLGLAFLSDVQVQMFLEAAQGDSRTNVMQAPKLTMFNGQSASLSVQDQQFFLTGITVSSISGVLTFTPQNNPFPIGVQMNLQPVISGDRRFVRLNIQQSMTNIASANVPLFPITTIITPTFDFGAVQGQPIPFTQYIQQPTTTTISVSTTVVVPDGGTVLLGGMKTLSEGRQEYGPPVLSKIPYIDRLFRNVGYGRDAQSLMMMVTPRIIINREEQEKQTGVTNENYESP